MNRQIVQLFGLFVLLFAVLLVFTSRWTVFEASSLTSNPDNRRPLIEEQKIPRGLIFAKDGHTQLARNVGHGRGENRTYTRSKLRGTSVAVGRMSMTSVVLATSGRGRMSTAVATPSTSTV